MGLHHITRLLSEHEGIIYSRVKSQNTTAPLPVLQNNSYKKFQEKNRSLFIVRDRFLVLNT